MNDDTMQPLEPRISGEFLVSIARLRGVVETDQTTSIVRCDGNGGG